MIDTILTLKDYRTFLLHLGGRLPLQMNRTPGSKNLGNQHNHNELIKQLPAQ